MTINVGDLVECRKNSHVGIVVFKRSANDCSMSEHMKNICPTVYYVYFSDNKFNGPYNTSDLLLKQSICA